jgi:hypothetical protein
MLTKHLRLYDTANRVYVEIEEDESQKQMNHLQTFLLRLTYEKNWPAIGLNKTIQNIKLKEKKQK